MKKYLLLSLAFLSLGFFTACGDDDNDENEEELITTLRYTLTPTNGTAVVMEFKDLDGDGGKNPTFTTSSPLKNGETYTGTLLVLNESQSPAEDITAEISAEDEEHQFFYEVTGNLAGNLAISYNDKDADNNPVGLKTTVKPSGVGTGKLKVTLRHEPNKSASSVSAGSIANAGGVTDIEVTFDVEVK